MPRANVMFMQAQPCRLHREMLMLFLLFLQAYWMEAMISGALDATGASTKLT